MIGIKQILSSIADIGQKIFRKSILKKNDLESIVVLCDDLLSNKGAAFGITVARDITELFKELSFENKLLFFKKINEKYRPSHTQVGKAIEIYNKSKNDKNLSDLFKISEGRRRELFRRMNMAPNGTSIIVSLREDLLKFLSKNKELNSLDADLRHLFRAWFNPGFLKLEKDYLEYKSSYFRKDN